MPEQEPYSLNFQIAGYSTTNFLINARSNLLLYAIQFFLVLFFVLLFYCMAKLCPNKQKKAKNYLFWNGSIRLFISNYLNLLLLSLLNIKEINNNEEHNDQQSKGVTASNCISIITLAHCIFVPIFISVYYIYNDHRIDDQEFNDKVGSFIEGAKR